MISVATTTALVTIDSCDVTPGCQVDGKLLGIPGECGKYRQCKNGQWENLDCPSGRLFDWKSLQCVNGTRSQMCLESCYGNTINTFISPNLIKI